MNVKKKLKGLIAMLVCMVLVMGSAVVTQAAGNPYPSTQDVDGDGLYEVPCTWFAWQQVYDNFGVALPKWGDAWTWFNGAKSAGYSTGSVPQPGSVAVWSGDTYGHVAYVTAVSGGNTFTVNEGGRTDLDQTSSHGVAYGYTLTNAVGQSRPYDPGKTLLGFIYINNSPSVSLNWSNIQATPSDNNASIHAEATTNISGSFTEAGITVWNEAGQVVGRKTEPSSVTGRLIKIDYDLANEVGAKLESGANYTYQIYTVFNGTKYETGIGNFRTTGSSVNAWTQELTMGDWVYGETAQTPAASAKYGQVVYTYSAERDGQYTTDKPQNAGTYFVKASVSSTDQYTGLEAIKSFTIYKAVPEYSVPENVTAVYGQTLADVSLPEGFVWTDDTEKVGDVGEKTFIASYVPEDTQNYETIGEIEITVTVEPKDLSGMELTGIDKNTNLDKYEIKDGDTILVKDEDYKISSKKDGNKVIVTVEFMGNYTGSTQASYVLEEKTAAKSEAKDAETSKTKAARTGDTVDFGVWCGALVLAGGTAVVISRKKRSVR